MIDKNGLKISSTLLDFINNESIPYTNINIKILRNIKINIHVNNNYLY